MIERKQLKLSIDELALGQSGLIEDSELIEVGKYMGTEIIITGLIPQFGSRIEVNDLV